MDSANPNPKPIDNLPSVPARPLDAHKGTFGTVIVVGGSVTMIGAPALCASGALRGGAGLVKIATYLLEVLPLALTIEPGATGILLPTAAESAVQVLDEADPKGDAILAIGPGMGQASSAGDLVQRLLSGHRAAVLDADGLNLLAATARPRPGAGVSGPPLVLTPHPGEFRRLARPLGISPDPVNPNERASAAAALASAHCCVVLLKGKDTVVSDGSRVSINHTGNPAMATAGMGDVLTGLIAALIAQGMSPFDAAVLGAFLHGSAADLWAQDHGFSGLTARDLASLLPRIFQKHRNRNKQPM